jgi:hypothetical protein
MFGKRFAPVKTPQFYFCNEDKKQSVLVYDLVSNFPRYSLKDRKVPVLSQVREYSFPKIKYVEC